MVYNMSRWRDWKGVGIMKKIPDLNQLVTLTVEIPAELAKGVQTMAKLKNVSEGSLIRLWIEDALERDELRFERLLLFADLASGLDEATLQAISRLKTRYFDEKHDGERGLDPYMVKNTNRNYLYRGTSGKIPT